MKRSLFLHALASASLFVAAGCTGDDDDGGNADGSSSNGPTTAPDDGDDGNDQPDDGNETPPDTGTDTNPPTDGNPDTGTDNSDDPTGDTNGDTDGTTGVPACPYDEVGGMPDLALQLVADGFDRPLLAMGDPVQPDRLFVLEQGGTVKILEPGMASAPAENFLEVSAQNAGNPMLGAESGALGFAFHPDWPDDARVYIHYNPPGGDSFIEEYTVDAADGSQVDPTSARTILRMGQPAGNHNGGMIAFGADDYMYIGMGDGGGANDQFNTGRNPNQLLAKMLRIGVEPDGTPDNPEICNSCGQQGPFDYTIPADNPGMDGSRAWAPEIFAMGFRNPWRFSIDPTNGEIYVADVGQGSFEEIDIVTLGADYGWSDMEGNNCFGGQCDNNSGPNTVNADGLTTPIHEYSTQGCTSVSGGAVYRSCEVPGWDGIYVFGETCDEWMRGIRWDGSSIEEFPQFHEVGEPIIGNGWNAWGDVFITTVVGDYGGGHSDGRVYRLAPG